MKKAVVYIHGKGGNAGEAERYRPLFPECDVIGFDYRSDTPWEAKKEFSSYFEEIGRTYEKIILVANSIGAYFAMNALQNKKIGKAYFISPIVDMERLISDMMAQSGVTEEELREKKRVKTPFGETLSWEYLAYVRENPIFWDVPTKILYGEKDETTSFATVCSFSERIGAKLDVMKGGEHWFHTEEQMKYLDGWIKNHEEYDD